MFKSLTSCLLYKKNPKMNIRTLAERHQWVSSLRTLCLQECFIKPSFSPLLSLSQDFEKPLCFSTTFSDGRNFSQDSSGLLEGRGRMLKNDDWCNTLAAFISCLQTSLCPYNTPLYGHEAILDEKKKKD